MLDHEQAQETNQEMKQTISNIDTPQKIAGKGGKSNTLNASKRNKKQRKASGNKKRSSIDTH